uniref:t-SNARE coiled-coil homology domain-containing protein n=1 Tax=Salix viminalis TaxID=40686 RepID=A0A6N2JYV4_SALVM
MLESVFSSSFERISEGSGRLQLRGKLHTLLLFPKHYTASELDVRSDKSPEQRALLVESRRQEVLLLDNEIVFNEAIIEEREQGIHEIQQQIGEVNEIFKDLAVLAATSQGKSQLVKAAKTQRSNSSLACLLLVIFGIVILIVIVVLAA